VTASGSIQQDVETVTVCGTGRIFEKTQKWLLRATHAWPKHPLTPQPTATQEA
jgi:hypothetical protein